MTILYTDNSHSGVLHIVHQIYSSCSTHPVYTFEPPKAQKHTDMNNKKINQKVGENVQIHGVNIIKMSVNDLD